MATVKPHLPRQPFGRHLSSLLGTWSIEVVLADADAAPLHGEASFRWLATDALLLMRSRVRGGPPSSVSTIGGDDTKKSYSMLHSDERGVARHYAMTLTSRVWKLTRDAPGFSQRFIARFSRNRRVIRGDWEKSSDGVKWEHDFAMIYTKKRE
jgi:hypothetical protein